jgi:hypothetical protein
MSVAIGLGEFKAAPVHVHREVTACRGRGYNVPSILSLGSGRKLVSAFRDIKLEERKEKQG